MRHLSLFAFAALVGCASSEGPDIEPLGSLTEHDAVVAAATTATIAGHPITPDAYVWVNGMPGDNGRYGLMATVKLSAADGTFPDDVELGRLFLVKGNDVWVTGVGELQTAGATRSGTARYGPADWYGGAPVDAVIRVDSPNAPTTYVAVRGVKIESPE